MTPYPHVIGKQVLEIEIEDGDDAPELQAEISELFWKEVVPALDRLLDQRAPPQHVLRLDRLEIDIGRLDRGRLGEVFPARVCEALETELAPLLSPDSRDAGTLSAKSERQSPGDQALALWHHLLAHGSLPWWASSDTAADLEARVETQLASLDRLPDTTYRLLRANPDTRRRLALQASPKTLELVLRLMDKALADASLPTLDAMIALLRVQPRASISAERFRQFWWEAALAEAVGPASNRTPMRSLRPLRQAIVVTARNASIPYPDLLTRLRSLVGSSQAPTERAIPSAQWQRLSAGLRDIAEADGSAGVTGSLAATKEARRRDAPGKEQDGQAGSKTEDALAPKDKAASSDKTKPERLSPVEDGSEPREGLEAPGEGTEEPPSSPVDRPTAQAERGPKDMATTRDETSVGELSEALEKSSEPGISRPGDQAAPRKNEKPRHLSPPRDGKTTRKQPEETGEAVEATSPSPRDREPPGGTEKLDGASAPSEATFRQSESEAPESAPDEKASPPGDSALPREQTGTGRGATAGERSRPGDDSAAGGESASFDTLQGDDRRSPVSATPTTVVGTSGSTGLLSLAETEVEPGVSTSTKGIREGEALYVEHTGIVLLHPFIPAHFEHLGLVRDNSFVDGEARERAVHQLHFLATGEDEPEEHRLPVAKLLCGLESETPIARRVPIDDRARSQAEELLKALIGHWSILGKTSPAGLREAFLQRPGRLTRKADGWSLKVKHETRDIVFSSLPWSISFVRLPWMSQLLRVEWA